jgi:GMP synthase (glutamine-hydrolysing)
VRIIGEVTEERLEVLRAADAIAREEIESANLDFEVWQYFCVLTPIQTVGVMGDGRTYENVLAVRAVTSEDGMTADCAPHICSRISSHVNEVRHQQSHMISLPPRARSSGVSQGIFAAEQRRKEKATIVIIRRFATRNDRTLVI